MSLHSYSLLSSRRLVPLSGLLAGLALTPLAPAFASTTSGPVLYQITDLGTLGGGASYAWAINSSGLVVGTSETSVNDASGSPLKHAFRYDTVLHDLGTPTSTTQSAAFAVNATGQVAGYSDYPIAGSSAAHAFRYDPVTGFLDLGVNGSMVNESYAFGINSSGSVTGWYFPAYTVPDQPFVYDSSFHNYAASGDFLVGINDSNGIAGSAQYSYGSETRDAAAVFANGGNPTVIGPSNSTSGGPNSYGTAINNNGLAVGYLDYSHSGFGYQNLSHAFSYNTATGTETDLGAPLGTDTSRAFGVNQSGDAVGTAYAGGNAPFLRLTYITYQQYFSYKYAALFQRGNAYNLNDLLTGLNTTGLTLGSAQGINDSGQIVGFGVTPSGAMHAFLLTPTTSRASGPAAPSNLQALAVPATAQVNLSWTDNSGGHAYTEIERRIGGGAFTSLALAAPGTTAYSDTQVVAGTMYSYQIKAQNSVGSSSYAASASATTPAAATDVTGQIKVVRGGFRNAHGSPNFGQILTLTNTGAALTGPISLVFDNLVGYLQNPAGTTQNALPSGSSYVTAAPSGLAHGASVTVILQFQLQYQGGGEDGPSVAQPVTYITRLLAGSGLR